MCETQDFSISYSPHLGDLFLTYYRTLFFYTFLPHFNTHHFFIVLIICSEFCEFGCNPTHQQNEKRRRHKSMPFCQKSLLHVPPTFITSSPQHSASHCRFLSPSSHPLPHPVIKSRQSDTLEKERKSPSLLVAALIYFVH